MYSILGHLHDSPVVQELLKSDPDALKTTHPIRLSIKEPLPSQDDKPLYGIVWNALDVVIFVRQAIRITLLQMLSNLSFPMRSIAVVMRRIT